MILTSTLHLLSHSLQHDHLVSISCLYLSWHGCLLLLLSPSRLAPLALGITVDMNGPPLGPLLFGAFSATFFLLCAFLFRFNTIPACTLTLRPFLGRYLPLLMVGSLFALSIFLTFLSVFSTITASSHFTTKYLQGK